MPTYGKYSSSNNWTTLGIAVDWGEVESTPQSAVWALGISRSPSIQYKAGSILEDRYPYFLSEYPDVESAVRLAMYPILSVSNEVGYPPL